MLSPEITIELYERFNKANSNVDTNIHPNDNMYMKGHDVGYLSVGRRALALVCETFDRERRIPKSILDFPSGWGRATRWFRAAFPEIKLGVGDVWHEAVEHVAHTYSASPIMSRENLSEVVCGSYDCMFVGSLVTHLSELNAIKFIDWAIDHLDDGGLAIITSHGRKARFNVINNPPPSAFPSTNVVADIVRVFNGGGFGFAPYSGRAADLMTSMNVSEYGHSLISPEWWMRHLMQRNDAELVGYIEQGWNNHQDVVVLKKSVI
jgi:hypothetical protein